MSSCPTVSILLPVFNAEPWIEECLASLLGQSLPSFEIVAVDDGSTDTSRAVLEQAAAAEPRLRVLANERNLGLVASINRAIEAARGDYLARMDADDVALPTRLEEQVRCLEKRPEVGVLATAYWRLFERGAPSLHRPPEEHWELRWRMLFGNVWCHPTVMMRRELLGALERPLYRDLALAEDYDLWLRAGEVTRLATLPDALVKVRTHEISGLSAPSSESQEASVRTLSIAQIRRRMGEQTESCVAAGVRECFHSTRIGESDWRHLAPLLSLLDSFARDEGLSRAQTSALLRHLVRRMLSRSSPTGVVRLFGRPRLAAAIATTPSLALRAAKSLLRPAVSGIGQSAGEREP